MPTAISINRAGKVRSHTPVCPKKIKPKAKNGRASIRAKYMKRLEMGYFDMKGKVKMNINTPRN
ncbi:uncharacterized protein VICG_01110 [Vittaforma corneae ATCC 50505]|uniref:40S ribosomal protein S30 n=1 Tax=Vittaforma corneae (strain ATCC 50505) TaxID=993615 RepID=L2GM58_VITCO|nr:uncharacterized protein VICG_01110 [Vittaforma corneae ATCC 50505]ELA41926.1 hypothetical protein VICG_01110 [Vittaforma corneae ATCC 50505]